ncbi:hypothetical protein cand_014200 [Cryptosporidium andersoni]|uniref:CID domain-containing protein n=1 Tax=Cryptosporidium andersoni TaxID=117008 RepID=A0A1J4MXY2_9CRYT|nr:hypothetical protein cand_014200 [Cryptosporidium andersoni]
MDNSSPEQIVRIRYAEVLRNLRSPAGSGRMIQNLTLLAEDQRQYAHAIASVILEEIPRSDTPRKYVLLCLVDSIVRKCRAGSQFFPYFLPYIAPYFAEAYTVKTPPNILRSLEKLLKVWSTSFPKDIMKRLLKTTNAIRSKLSEPPLDITLTPISTNTDDTATQPILSSENSLTNTSVNNIKTNHIPKLQSINTSLESGSSNNSGQISSDVATQIVLTILQAVGISGDEITFRTLINDPNVQRIAKLQSEGKTQEAQHLVSLLIRNVGGLQQTLSTGCISETPISINNHTPILGVQPHFEQPPNKRIKPDHININKLMETQQINNKKVHDIPIQSKHVTLNTPIQTNQTLHLGINQTTPIAKKTFSPRFTEPCSAFTSVWMQLFKSKPNFKSANTLELIPPSIVDAKGNQSLYIEGLEIKEINHLFQLYQQLQSKVYASTKFRKKVWLHSHFIKRRMDGFNDFDLQSTIGMYYSDRPNQCHICGFRFIDSKKKEAHLQIHLTKNLVLRQRKQMGSSQTLWSSLGEWIYGSEGNDRIPTKEELFNANNDYIDNNILSNTKNSTQEDNIIDISNQKIILEDIHTIPNGLIPSDNKVIEDSNSILSCFSKFLKKSGTDTTFVIADNLIKCESLNEYNNHSIDFIQEENQSKIQLSPKFNQLHNHYEIRKQILQCDISDLISYSQQLNPMWNEMKQNVSISFAPIDTFHFVCSICHEPLKIQWSSDIKSWICRNAVLAVPSNMNCYQKLSQLLLTSVDYPKSHQQLSKINVRDSIYNQMLDFIQWDNHDEQTNYFNSTQTYNQLNSNLHDNIKYQNTQENQVTDLWDSLGNQFQIVHKLCFAHYSMFTDLVNLVVDGTKNQMDQPLYSKDNIGNQNKIRRKQKIKIRSNSEVPRKKFSSVQ